MAGRLGTRCARVAAGWVGAIRRGRSFLGNVTAQFAGDGRRLVIFGRRSSGTTGVDVLGLPELMQLEQIETPGEGLLAVRGDRLITARPRAPNGSGADIVFGRSSPGDARRLGSFRGGAQRPDRRVRGRLFHLVSR